MELVVKRIMASQRDVQGFAVILEVEVGGMVLETCRLVLPTDGDISALRRILDDALSGYPRTTVPKPPVPPRPR
jgi:hypothetical protein